MAIPYSVTPYSWVSSDGKSETYDSPPPVKSQLVTVEEPSTQEPSPVYAVPWKAKNAKTPGNRHISPSPCVSPPPPPVPPRIQNIDDATSEQISRNTENSVEAHEPVVPSKENYTAVRDKMCNAAAVQSPTVVNHSAVHVVEMQYDALPLRDMGCTSMAQGSENHYQDPRNVSVMDGDNVCGKSPYVDGWRRAVVARPFIPPQPCTTSYVSSGTYDEILSPQGSIPSSVQSDSPVTSQEHKSAGQNAADFSFSKYLISSTQEESSAEITGGDEMMHNACDNTGNAISDIVCDDHFVRSDQKRKAFKSDVKFTMKVTDGHLNSKCFEVNPNQHLKHNEQSEKKDKLEYIDTLETDNRGKNETTLSRKNPPLLGSKSPRRNMPELGKQAWHLKTPEKDLHQCHSGISSNSKSEGRVRRQNDENASTPGTIRKKMKGMNDQVDSYLETDIDSMPVPMMGSKTPPRQRKPLISLPRSKSMETIIW